MCLTNYVTVSTTRESDVTEGGRESGQVVDSGWVTSSEADPLKRSFRTGLEGRRVYSLLRQKILEGRGTSCG